MIIEGKKDLETTQKKYKRKKFNVLRIKEQKFK